MDRLTKSAVVGGGAGTVMIAAAQTNPEDAASNIAGWLNMLGVNQVPDVLERASADMWATLLGLTAVALAAISLLAFRLKPSAEPATAPIQQEPQISLPVLTDRQKESTHAALVAMHEFLDMRVGPFVSLAGKVAAWTDLVRESGHFDAMAKLRVLRERILPLAADFGALGRRYQPEFETLGISPDCLLGSIEVMVLPVENLYVPVWQTGFARRLIFWKPPIDVYPGQEEALLKRTRQLEDSARDLRARLNAALDRLADRPQ